jgi:type I restriction enzyme S subunit
VKELVSGNRDWKEGIPHSWRRVRIGDVCDLVGGSTPPTGNQAYWDGHIVWVTPTDLGMLGQRTISSSARRITTTGFESCGTQLLPVGTVVMSSRAPIGHLGIAGVPLCTNQGCKSFVPGPEVDAVFLYWLLKRAVPTIKAIGSGATFAEVSKSTLEYFEIPLPSLAEQKRIAAILDEQMASVARARAAAQALLDDAKALPAAYLRQVFPQPGQALPAAWRWVRLGDLCSGKGQYGLSLKASPEVAGLPLLRMGNIQEGSVSWDDLKYVVLPEETEAEFVLLEGDLLINRTNSAELVGKSAVFEGSRKAVFGSYLIRFRVLRDKADPRFLVRYINSFGGREFVHQNMGRAIGQVNISASTLLRMPVPLPDPSEQQRIAAELDAQTAVSQRLQMGAESQLAEINALSAAVLRKAFNGEL